MLSARHKGFRRTLMTSTAAIAAMTLAADARAQQQQQTAEDEELSLEEIIVTGSRIRRSNFEDIQQPAIVIDSEQIESRGFRTLSEALNENPLFFGGNSRNTLGSGQNVGQEFLNLFNLGTQRTLVVVNGRRFVPGNVLSADPVGRTEGSQVDLNNFPVALVDRVETLSIGGAPIYGADAIAGTTNIILKDDFEGVDLSFQYSNRFNPTTVDNYSVNGVFGANTADGRGNVVASVQFEDQRGATTNDFPRLRDRASCFGDGANRCILGPNGNFNILDGPEGFLPAPTAGVPIPGFGLNVFRDENGNVLTFPGNGGLDIFDPGEQIGTSAIFFSGGNGFDNDDFNEALTPVRRFVFSSLGHYDVSDNIQVFMETNFLDSSSTDLISQSSSAFNTAFLNAPGQGAFGVSIDNPFLSEGDRQTLINAGSGQTFFLNGINLGLLPDAGANFVDTTTFRVVGGLKGGFEFLERNLNWEVSMNYGQTRQTRNVNQVLAGQFFNAVDSVRLNDETRAQLLDPDNLALLEETVGGPTINVVRGGNVLALAPGEAQNGDIICGAFLNAPGAIDRDVNNPRGNTGISTGNTASPDPSLAGCTPLNLFAGSNNPEEAINFVTSSFLSTGKVTQADFVGYISGDFVELPAGWSQFSVGWERRREFGSFTSGGTSEANIARDRPIPNVPQEEIVSNEFMAEAVIPVLSRDFNLGINDALGFDFITSLEFTGAYRFIKPSNLDNNVNIYTAGGSIGMFGGDLVVRGNWTRSVRQPSIIELFAPPAQAFNQTGDPCDNRNINNAPDTPRAQNCLVAAQQQGFGDARLIDVDGGVALELAPGDGPFQTPSVNAAIPLNTSGNPDLSFEIANSWTAGFIWQPDFVSGLTIGADWISIDLRDTIVEPAFSFFTQNCFDTSNFAAGNVAASCNNFERSGPTTPVDASVVSGFDIVTGETQFLNSDTLRLKAIQGQVRYEFELADLASMIGFQEMGNIGSVRLNNTIYAPIVFRNSASAISSQRDGKVANQVGSTNQPNWTLVSDVAYNYNKFSFFWRTTVRSNVEPCFNRVSGSCDDEPLAALPLPKDVEVDASLAYQLTDNLNFRGGVDNIMGNSASIAEEAFTTGANFFGRRFFLRLGFTI